jgi:8-oxo-dGTP pyrophosphatase MutT (NUDIX family)
VLVPLIHEAHEAHDVREAAEGPRGPRVIVPPRLLFTVRTADLPTHPGQISFPGGKRDPIDETLEETALREAREELGLAQGVRILGRLDDVPTPAGFVITPVVGALAEPLGLAPNAREVAEVFSVPLPELRRVYQAGGERDWMGVRYVMHEYPYERWRIWGATAAMVQQLLGLLEGEG